TARASWPRTRRRASGPSTSWPRAGPNGGRRRTAARAGKNRLRRTKALPEPGGSLAMLKITRRRAIALAAIAALALPLPAAAKTTLRLAHSLAKDHPVDKAMENFAALVKERSDGEIEVRVFAAS